MLISHLRKKGPDHVVPGRVVSTKGKIEKRAIDELGTLSGNVKGSPKSK